MELQRGLTLTEPMVVLAMVAILLVIGGIGEVAPCEVNRGAS